MGVASANCVIIGPTQSGKTSLLGVLQLATAQIEQQPGKAIRILPQSPHMGELITLSNSQVRLGQAPITATLGIKEYEFDCEIIHSAPGNMFRRTSTTRFSMIDAPGGAILGDEVSWAGQGFNTEEMQGARAKIIDQLKTATYIIMCVDSTDEKSAIDFVQYLPEVLRETGQKRLACEKLVICLTKADEYVINHPGISTREEFLYQDPAKRASRIISRAGLNILRTYLREDADIRVGWASAYGFDPETGRPNYDPETQSFLVDASVNATPAEILERWQPYRVIEPFVFLTNGDPMNLSKMSSLASHVGGLEQPVVFDRLRPHSNRVGGWLRTVWAWIRGFYDFVKFGGR